MLKANNKPLLNDVTVEITNHCQLRCQHCGIWAEKKRHEMSAALVIQMMQELLHHYRIYFVSITGGEPFLYKNCGHLLKALSTFRDHGKIAGFGVYSNAACFAEVHSVLSAYGKYLNGMNMGISIDGGQETHDRLRGVGSYQKTLKTLHWISETFGKKIILELKFTINRINYAELADVYRLARRYGARFSPKIMESNVVDYYHRHSRPGVEYLASLTPKMIDSIRAQVRSILRDNHPGVDRELIEAMVVLLASGAKCIRACDTPARSLFITSQRKVYPCLYMLSAGKVTLDGKLPEGLDSVRKKHADSAARVDCPRCFAFHGFLKNFNLKHLEEQPAPQHQHR